MVRKSFSDIGELKSSVYAALVKYLMEKEIIRTAPFDASVDGKATIEDIDPKKIKHFIRLAKLKRGFVLDESVEPEVLLTHLNLLEGKRVKNAAVLLFGKNPQRFFITSEIRCAYFQGTEAIKPIQSYKVFKGDVFELVSQAVEFVLNKLDYRIETRKDHVSIPGSYEIPKEIINEAIVNAVAHRDYTSNASVQVMMFRDRIEVWNPGSLPLGWTTEKLKELHNSVPANPLLAEPMYLAAYIERLGTGTTDMLDFAKNAKLPEPKFIQEDMFRTIVYRPQTEQVSGEVGHETQTEKELRDNYGINTGDLRDKYGINVLGIIRLIYCNNNITLPKLAESLNISLSTVEKSISKLRKDKIIERVGSKKSGKWKVLAQN